MDISSEDANAKQRGQISISHRAGLSTRNTGFIHCEQRKVLRTSYTKSQCLLGKMLF